MNAAVLWACMVFGGLCLSACATSPPLPPKALALNQAGADALEKGELDTADVRLSLALEYNPRFVEALTNLANVELQRGNFIRARKLFTRARRINPDLAQPHHGLGVLAEREGRPDLAARHYQEALRIDPGFQAARANYARLLFNAGRLEDARIQFARLLESASRDAAGYAGLAEALIRLNRIEEADHVIEQGRSVVPNDPLLVILAARTALRQGHASAALRLLEPLSQGRDDHAVTALSWIAVAELLRSRPSAARQAAARAAALNPHDPLTAYVVAVTLTSARDPGAAAWSRRARRLVAAEPKLDRALAAAANLGALEAQ